MGRDVIRYWTCDAGERFEDDEGLARQLAHRIDDHNEDRMMFARDGCMLRLTWEDGPYPAGVTVPADSYRRSRTYSVTLVTNSPTCEVGNVFTAAWPNGYHHAPVVVAAQDAPSAAPVVEDATMNDIMHVLSAIGVVLWPDRYAS